jgi:protein-disulfide isomerase
MLLKFILSALTLAAFGMPVPQAPQGFVQGPAYSNRTLEVYMDHLCSACKASYPALSQYYTANSSWLKLVIYMFPLPYHNNSFVVT